MADGAAGSALSVPLVQAWVDRHAAMYPEGTARAWDTVIDVRFG